MRRPWPQKRNDVACPTNGGSACAFKEKRPAPTVGDDYYRRRRREILDFQVAYAKCILGRDNVVILCDRPTRTELARELPEDVLLVGPMRDVWMRDCVSHA